MNKALAMTRAHWQAMSSYRVQFMLSIVGLLATVVPVYLIAKAVQPVMAESIKAEGGHAFGFLVVGLAAYSLVTVAITSLPQVVGGEIGSGVFEALLATPTPTPVLMLGMNLFDLLVAALRCAVLLAAAWILGTDFTLGQLLPAIAVLALIVLAHLPFGVMGAALVIAFRTAGVLPKAVLLVSGLLGGVYYSTSVIPSWLRSVSEFVPLSYGLRALRRVLLQGASLSAVAPDLIALAGAAALLLAVSAVALTSALRYARRQGTLAQY